MLKGSGKNNKGFTLIEIIGVIIILGILIIVGTTAVKKYIEDSKMTTYESYKKDLSGATNNLMIECLNNNEEDCIIPSYGNDLKITYNELVTKGYSKQLKDPEADGYCDKSYVIVKNQSEDSVDLSYQVCLFCSEYKSTESGCQETSSSDITPPTCDYTKLVGSSQIWSKDDRVISIGCSDSDSGCTLSTFSKKFGVEGEVIEKSVIEIEDKAGNINSCEVDVYVDKKKPTCELEVVGISSNSWYQSGVTVNLKNKNDEGSGLLEYGMGTSLTSNYNEKESYVVTENGIVTVFGYVKDKAGNENYCSTEIKVDNTKPTGTIYMGYEIYPKEDYIISGNNITINNTSKYGTISKLNLTFNSNISGNYLITVYNENNTVIGSALTSPNKNNLIISITEGSYTTLKITFANTTLRSNLTKVEALKQENITSVWTNKDVSVYIDASDTITGVDKYSFDTGSTYQIESIKTYSSNTSGIAKVKDKVGNISDDLPYTINKIDKTLPILSVNAYRCSDQTCTSSTKTYISNTSTNNGTLTINWTNLSGSYNYTVTETNFAYVEWKWNDSDNYEYTAINENNREIKTSKTGTVSLTTPGYRTGRIRAYDLAGNYVTVNVEVKIDRTAPVMYADIDQMWEWNNVYDGTRSYDDGTSIHTIYNLFCTVGTDSKKYYPDGMTVSCSNTNCSKGTSSLEAAIKDAINNNKSTQVTCYVFKKWDNMGTAYYPKYNYVQNTSENSIIEDYHRFGSGTYDASANHHFWATTDTLPTHGAKPSDALGCERFNTSIYQKYIKDLAGNVSEYLYTEYTFSSSNGDESLSIADSCIGNTTYKFASDNYYCKSKSDCLSYCTSYNDINDYTDCARSSLK